MSTSLKRKRRPTYTEETLTKAIEDVKSGAALNVISRKYKIPRTTLHARVTNKHSSRLGTKPALSNEDEADLAKWIENMCSIGCSVSRNQIGDSVLLSLKTLNKPNPFVNKRPGKNWFDGFLRRHSLYEKVRERRCQLLKGIGVDGTNKWFADLNNLLKKEKLHALSRTRTYSIGEVSLPLHLKTNSWCVKEGPTVLITVNAAGHLLPPMIVFDSDDNVSSKYNMKLPSGWSVKSNDDGDMSAEFLYDYIKNHLYPWLVKNTVELPIVLFLYHQLASYLTQVLCDFCDKRKILLVISPSSPHRATTPIEISLFPIVKREFTRKLRIFVQKMRLLTIDKNDFIVILEEALNSTNVKNNLESGFYKCGLYPLSPERYVRACIQLTPEEDIVNVIENETRSVQSPIVDQSSLLKCIESYLDAATIESFRSVNDSCTWTGKVEDTNLFYIWRKFKNSAIFQDQKQSEVIVINDKTNNESVELESSDLDNNENQENKKPSGCTLVSKSCVTREKSLRFINNNLNSECFDRNARIIVINPNGFIEESASDEN